MIMCMYRVHQKCLNLFLSEFCQISGIFHNLLTHICEDNNDCVRCTHFTTHLGRNVDALPCKMQMLQIFTLCSDYQDQIAHFLSLIR